MRVTPGPFSLAEGFEEVFGLLDGGFEVGRSIIWDDDEERFVHNIGFLGKNVNKVDVIIHQNAKEHVVVVATHLDEALNIWSNVDALGADEDLDGEIERVEEILVTIFYAFAFGFGHEVEVDGLASYDGTERAVFHNDETIAKLGEH